MLPDPLPDNPMKWDGWRFFNSDNPYERLCLAFEANPSEQQVEENCRKLLVWWQKKLPLKSQPSNPLSQLLRAGLDDAPSYLSAARAELLNPESRARTDALLREKLKAHAKGELLKFLSFSVAGGFLTEGDESNLHDLGVASGLTPDEIKALIDEEIEKRGAKRKANVEAVAPPPPVFVVGGAVGFASNPNATAPPKLALPTAPAANASDEFRRLLRLSGLDEEDMTDDQRDALCNMGENLGLTGGQAEDLIDEYLEQVSGVPLSPPVAIARPPVQAAKPAAAKQTSPAVGVAEPPARQVWVNVSPLAREQERQKHPNFRNALGAEMLFVPSGAFFMGTAAPDAAPNEQPVSRVTISCFYMARHPVTNAQYERFDPSHRAKRMPGAGDDHPVVYVSSLDAVKFCQWLNARDKHKYRLPTEAEWEYAARGMDGRTFPWGEILDSGQFANFADRRTSFAWRDIEIDDGYAETSPVGAYPRGASPFGIEDMAGNVWEWCLDFLVPYNGKERVNPRGPETGTKRVYRGGSWKSRASSLRAMTRNFNLPAYSSNDVGFRVVCECE
jgi:formylglycine-generating enzyme required for sulfatase activity